MFIDIINPFDNETAAVAIKHISEIYISDGHVIIRMDSGSRYFTSYPSIDAAKKHIAYVVGAEV